MKYTPVISGMIIIFLITVSGCSAKKPLDSPAAAQAGDSIISVKDVEAFKKLKGDTLTDKQAVDMLVEKNVLFQESQNAGIAVSLQEAKEYAKEQRKIIETTGGEQAKKVMDDLTNGLGVTYDEYWDQYAPKGYMRALSEAKMKKKLKDDIREEILKDNSNLSADEIQKASEEAYTKMINNLIIKYDVKYYIQ